MSKPVPKHRAARHRAPRKPLFTRPATPSPVALTGLAAAVTGVAVGAGILASGFESAVAVDPAAGSERASLTAASADLSSPVEAVLGDRVAAVSRSDARGRKDERKREILADSSGGAVTGEQNLSDSDPREIGRQLLAEYGFGSEQFTCLDSLYTRESNWTVNADNPTSSAYGIPQALPGEKMASAGADWATNPVTQIRWGLGYIEDVYGTPCGAWGHSQSVGWY